MGRSPCKAFSPSFGTKTVGDRTTPKRTEERKMFNPLTTPVVGNSGKRSFLEDHEDVVGVTAHDLLYKSGDKMSVDDDAKGPSTPFSKGRRSSILIDIENNGPREPVVTKEALASLDEVEPVKLGGRKQVGSRKKLADAVVDLTATVDNEIVKKPSGDRRRSDTRREEKKRAKKVEKKFNRAYEDGASLEEAGDKEGSIEDKIARMRER